MAVGTRLTYTDTNRNRTIISTAIEMIDWMEAPLLKLLGTDNQSKFGITKVGTKINWMEDTMSPTSTTINEGGAFADNDTTLTVAEGSYFKAGDILKIESELLYVSAVSGNNLTVVRAWGASTAAAHADGTAVALETHASLEGSDAVTGHTTVISVPYNYTQIIREAVKVSGTEKENPKWDSADTMTYHLNKLIGNGGKAGKLPIQLEATFKNIGLDVGSATASRGMGGFDSFVTTNVTALGGAALTRKAIEDAFQACYLAGGSPETIVVPAWARRKISSFYEKYITTERSEKRGGSKITTIETDFGDMEVMFWRWCPVDTLYIIEKGQMGWVTMRPFDVYDRASVGDYELKDVLGEFSFVLKNEKAHAKISGFSTTA